MLRYLAYGPKNFARSPLLVSTRYNWEFYANLTGWLHPTLPSGKTVPPGESTLWLFSPNTAHGWVSSIDMERVVFHFSSVPELVEKLCPSGGYLQVSLRPEEIGQMRQLAKTLDPHYRAPNPASLLHFQRALLDLSLILLRDRRFDSNLPLETVAVERVERAVQWYLARLENRPTLDALAEAVHVSPAHLRRQFQQVYGKSPHTVLTHLRLERAMEMLASTSDTIETIARQSGFNSASDLCRVFHRHYNVYPNVWRTYVSGTETTIKQDQVSRIIARSGTPEFKPNTGG
jgi:AraC family transcriptional regulator